MRRVLVTGSRGFVGQHLVSRLAMDGHAITRADRTPLGTTDSHQIRAVATGDIGPATDWREALRGCDTVVHLAGQTSSDDGGRRCHSVNDEGTLRLVSEAAASGVETFVFLSSVMAVVDNTFPGVVAGTTPSTAQSHYGQSKLRAEAHVGKFAGAGRCGVSLRPPAIYGRGAKGNMERLRALSATALPLPLGAVSNRRTLVSVANLVDAICKVVALGPAGPSGTFLVSDRESVSTADIVRRLRTARGRPARLVPVPVSLMRLALRTARLHGIADSLLDDLVIDCQGFNEAYRWAPPQSAEAAITSWA